MYYKSNKRNLVLKKILRCSHVSIFSEDLNVQKGGLSIYRKSVITQKP